METFQKKFTEIKPKYETLKEQLNELETKRKELTDKLEHHHSEISKLKGALDAIEMVKGFRFSVRTKDTFKQLKCFLFDNAHYIMYYNENGGGVINLKLYCSTENIWSKFNSETSKVLDMRDVFEICFEKEISEEERTVKIIQKFDDFISTN